MANAKRSVWACKIVERPIVLKSKVAESRFFLILKVLIFGRDNQVTKFPNPVKNKFLVFYKWNKKIANCIGFHFLNHEDTKSQRLAKITLCYLSADRQASSLVGFVVQIQAAHDDTKFAEQYLYSVFPASA